MNELQTFEMYARAMMDECQSAEMAIQARKAQEFFEQMLGLRLDLDESYRAWKDILSWWEQAKQGGESATTFREVLLAYFLKSRQLKEPIVTEFQELQRLRLSSTTDHLTHTNNRAFFDAILAKEVPRAARYGEDLSLVLIDLDRFKDVNDTHGHAVGDQVLVVAGKVLKGMVRISDFVFRVGGDEFAVVLPATNHLGATILADRSRQRFADETANIPELNVPITLSYGVATCPREATDAKALFNVADQRLYQFKRAVNVPRYLPRRHKRIPAHDLNAYVVLRSENIAREGILVDFSFGGVGLRLPDRVDLPDTLLGDLHLPILPAASVPLRKVFERPDEESGYRVGCAFVEPLMPAIPKS